MSKNLKIKLISKKIINKENIKYIEILIFN